MKSAVVQYDDFVFIGAVLGELIEIDLKCFGTAGRHLQKEAITVNWGERTEKIGRLEYLMKGADGLYALCGKSLSIFGKQPKPALILKI